MARINCSVSDDLKARMDAVGDRIRWSEIASAAFEEALARDAAINNAADRSDVGSSKYPSPIMDLGRCFVTVDGASYSMASLMRAVVAATPVIA